MIKNHTTRRNKAVSYNRNAAYYVKIPLKTFRIMFKRIKHNHVLTSVLDLFVHSTFKLITENNSLLFTALLNRICKENAIDSMRITQLQRNNGSERIHLAVQKLVFWNKVFSETQRPTRGRTLPLNCIRRTGLICKESHSSIA